MVSGVGREMGVLDGVVIVKRKACRGGVNLRRLTVTIVDFATRLFPNFFGQDLFCSPNAS